MNKVKIAILIVLAMLGYGGFRGWRKWKGAQGLQFDIRNVGTPRLDGISAIIFPLEIVAINPSNESFTITYPVIKMSFAGGSQVATSLPRNEKLTIKRNGETVFPMDIRIGGTDILSIGTGEALQIIKNKSLKGQKMKLDVTTAFMGLPINITGYEKQF